MVARSHGRSSVRLRLQSEQVSVGAATGQQLFVAPDLGEAASLQDHDSIGHTHGGEAMGDEHGDLVRCQSPEAEEDLVLGLGITHSKTAYPKPHVPKIEMLHALQDGAAAADKMVAS